MTNSNKKKRKTNNKPPDNPKRVSGGPTTRQTMCSRKSERTEVTTSDQYSEDNCENEEDLTTDPNEGSPMPKMRLKTDKGKVETLEFESEWEPEQSLNYNNITEMMSSMAKALHESGSFQVTHMSDPWER